MDQTQSDNINRWFLFSNIHYFGHLKCDHIKRQITLTNDYIKRLSLFWIYMLKNNSRIFLRVQFGQFSFSFVKCVKEIISLSHMIYSPLPSSNLLDRWGFVEKKKSIESYFKAKGHRLIGSVWANTDCINQWFLCVLFRYNWVLD